MVNGFSFNQDKRNLPIPKNVLSFTSFTTEEKTPEANHLYKKEEVGSFPLTDATTSAVCLNKPKCDWSMKQNSLMKKTLLSAA